MKILKKNIASIEEEHRCEEFNFGILNFRQVVSE